MRFSTSYSQEFNPAKLSHPPSEIELKKTISELNQTVTQLTQKLLAANSTISSLKSQLEITNRKVDNLTMQLQNATSTVSKLSSELESARSTLNIGIPLSLVAGLAIGVAASHLLTKKKAAVKEAEVIRERESMKELMRRTGGDWEKVFMSA